MTTIWWCYTRKSNVRVNIHNWFIIQELDRKNYVHIIYKTDSTFTSQSPSIECRPARILCESCPHDRKTALPTHAYLLLPPRKRSDRFRRIYYSEAELPTPPPHDICDSCCFTLWPLVSKYLHHTHIPTYSGNPIALPPTTLNYQHRALFVGST